MITGQFASGGAKPVVKQFNHRPGEEVPPEEGEYRSDDCLWLFNTVPAYVKETGDLAFYQKVLPYADKGEGSVFAHLRRALEFNLNRLASAWLALRPPGRLERLPKTRFQGREPVCRLPALFGSESLWRDRRPLASPPRPMGPPNIEIALEANILKHAWAALVSSPPTARRGHPRLAQRRRRDDLFGAAGLGGDSGAGSPEQPAGDRCASREKFVHAVRGRICHPAFVECPTARCGPCSWPKAARIMAASSPTPRAGW